MIWFYPICFGKLDLTANQKKKKNEAEAEGLDGLTWDGYDSVSLVLGYFYRKTHAVDVFYYLFIFCLCCVAVFAWLKSVVRVKKWPSQITANAYKVHHSTNLVTFNAHIHNLFVILHSYNLYVNEKGGGGSMRWVRPNNSNQSKAKKKKNGRGSFKCNSNLFSPLLLAYSHLMTLNSIFYFVISNWIAPLIKRL